VDRKIFKYKDCGKDVYVDPTEVDYQIAKLGIEALIFSPRLMGVPLQEDGTIDMEKADPRDMDLLLDSYHEAEPLIRQAFGIGPFSRETGQGMLFQDVIETFNNYLEWRMGVKKNGESPPASPPPTASATSSSPPTPGSRPSMASSSTRNSSGPRPAGASPRPSAVG